MTTDINLINELIKESNRIYKEEFDSVANDEFKERINSLANDLKRDVRQKKIIDVSRLIEFDFTLEKRIEDLYNNLVFELGISIKEFLRKNDVDIDSDVLSEWAALKVEIAKNTIDINKDISRITYEEKYVINREVLLPRNRGIVYTKEDIVTYFDEEINKLKNAL